MYSPYIGMSLVMDFPKVDRFSPIQDNYPQIYLGYPQVLSKGSLIAGMYAPYIWNGTIFVSNYAVEPGACFSVKYRLKNG